MPNTEKKVELYYEHTTHNSVAEALQETTLQEAQRLVHGNRQADYGHPLDDYTKVAAFWSIILRDIMVPWAKITPAQATLMMVCLKISREMNKHKRDNMVDGAGYFEVTNMIYEEQEKRKNESGNPRATHAEGHGCGCNNTSDSGFKREK